MLDTQAITKEVTTALSNSVPGAPPILDGLRALGLGYKTVAGFLGVDVEQVSLWYRGKDIIALDHYPKLISLLQISYAEATRILGEVSARANPPAVEKNLKPFRDRVRRAGEILEDLEQR